MSSHGPRTEKHSIQQLCLKDTSMMFVTEMESLLLFLLTESVLGQRTVKRLLKELLVCETGLAFVMETVCLLL